MQSNANNPIQIKQGAKAGALNNKLRRERGQIEIKPAAAESESLRQARPSAPDVMAADQSLPGGDVTAELAGARQGGEAPFTRFQMDIEHLRAISFHRRQMQANDLPRFLYVIRELSCGAQFLAFSRTLAKTCSTSAVDRFLRHLKNYGIDTSRVIFTTNRRVEFDGRTIHYKPRGFHLTIEEQYQARHCFNRSACAEASAEVESFEKLIRTQLFDAQVFSSRTDFFAKTAIFQLWYNIARKNAARGGKSPADLLAIQAPQVSPKILLLNPVPLESVLSHHGGHDASRQPEADFSSHELTDFERVMEICHAMMERGRRPSGQ